MLTALIMTYLPFLSYGQDTNFLNDPQFDYNVEVYKLTDEKLESKPGKIEAMLRDVCSRGWELVSMQLTSPPISNDYINYSNRLIFVFKKRKSSNTVEANKLINAAMNKMEDTYRIALDTSITRLQADFTKAIYGTPVRIFVEDYKESFQTEMITKIMQEYDATFSEILQAIEELKQQ